MLHSAESSKECKIHHLLLFELKYIYFINESRINKTEHSQVKYGD